MTGLLGTLHSAKSGMSVSQTSIETTSHNINNMNTPGYTRQRVEQSAKSAYSNPGFNSSLGAGQIGTGVEATDIIRIRNTFYDFQYRSESHSYGEISIENNYYNSMESIFNEPSDNAISTSINDFYNGWHELSKDPYNVGAKNIVIETSKYLADNINTVYNKLDNLKVNIDNQLKTTVDDINKMISDLTELDKNIKIVEGSGKTPNDLLDDRDRIIDELGFKMNLTDPKVQEKLREIYDNGSKLTESDITGENSVFKSGELAGLVKMTDEIENYKTKLNDLAEGIANITNEIYKDKDDKKKDFFIFKEDGSPILQVNPELEKNPSSMEITSEIATKMYNSKNEKVQIGNLSDKITINNFYNNIIQDLGQSTQAVIKEEANQSKLITSIDGSRVSVSGVSLDEEMVDLIQFQHAYNASAKVISTIDSLLDVVINGLVR